MKTIFVGIPILNRLDLLEECATGLDHPSAHVVIINNSLQPDFRTKLEKFCKDKEYDLRSQRYNLGVAGSWNRLLMIGAGLGYEHIYIGSNDTTLIPGSLARAEEAVRNDDEFMWHITGWNFFCIRCAAVQRIGLFDENFYPAYWEDADYGYRCDRLSGGARRVLIGESVKCRDNSFCPLVRKVPGVAAHHRESSTLRSDAAYFRKCRVDKRLWRIRYYRQKWGGLPGHERYKTPFGKTDVDLRWWTNSPIDLISRDFEVALGRIPKSPVNDQTPS
jgi:GT2 family glycosyltransferase